MIHIFISRKAVEESSQSQQYTMETPKEENCETTPREESCGSITETPKEENCELNYIMETPKDWQPATDLGDPTFWLSYEYKQIQVEMQKLNEKMDLILSILQKKPKKSTITEVDKKVDNLINIMHKKRKVEE